MIGASGVIGGRGIISVDYQYDAYGSMKTSDSQGDFDIFNQGVKNYFKSTNTLRIGGEYRITPQFSVRAGYNYSSTAVKPEAANGDIEVITAGTDPGYTLQNTTNTFSAGLGYRSRGFYVDLPTSTVTRTQPIMHSPISRITMATGWKLLLQRLI